MRITFICVSVLGGGGVLFWIESVKRSEGAGELYYAANGRCGCNALATLSSAIFTGRLR